MIKRDVAFLQFTITTTDDAGNPIDTVTTEKKIYVTVESIGNSEFFKAYQSGITPDFRLRTDYFEYGGNATIRYAGEVYEIYRTYQSGKSLELYLKKKVGDYGN